MGERPRESSQRSRLTCRYYLAQDSPSCDALASVIQLERSLRDQQVMRGFGDKEAYFGAPSGWIAHRFDFLDDERPRLRWRPRMVFSRTSVEYGHAPTTVTPVGNRRRPPCSVGIHSVTARMGSILSIPIAELSTIESRTSSCNNTPRWNIGQRRHYVPTAAAGSRSIRTRRIEWSATSRISSSIPSYRNVAPGSGSLPSA